ncbi:MAG: formate dehydrogenase accessory sulfurtransferase FdhD [Actinobacteria bacterium]|nr:formate dehydrogenase accessory sulfurtransferase FdhD [Actinomycetota bacterium]MBI3687883.1 formate dehydrogenase accessory sulfurtransferase FdhD [Actinomycetota bacterium]
MDGSVVRRDELATEEPMEIRVSAGARSRAVAVTMRTPGADFELVAGFLHSEGVAGVRRISYCVDSSSSGGAGDDSDDADDRVTRQRFNVVTAWLDELPDLAPLERYGYTSSACGVCGKASLDALRARGLRSMAGDRARIPVETLLSLPDRLRQTQGVFGRTGGLHAAAVFDPAGELLCVREDVGRHNAVDKVVGWAALAGRLPLSGHLLLVSGRTSYEILQKAVAAQIPIVCAISAPSSLAVSMAEEFGVTLVGFLRDGRCNVYAGADRITPQTS